MRLWAIGWLALWGVVFGLNDNLVIFAQAPGFRDMAGIVEVDDADLGIKADKLKIAKKNLDLIGTSFTEGSTADIEAKIEAYEKAIENQIIFLKKYYYRKSDDPSLGNAESIEAEINEIKTGTKLTRNRKNTGVNKKEYEICTEISNDKLNPFFAVFSSCSLETAQEFIESKIRALNLLKLAYTKKNQVIEKKSKAQKTEENLIQGIDPLVVADRKKYQTAKLNEKENRAMLEGPLELFASNYYTNEKSGADLRKMLENKDEFNKEIALLEAAKTSKSGQEYNKQAVFCERAKGKRENKSDPVCDEGQIKAFIVAKITLLKAFSMNTFIEELNNLKIIDKYQTKFDIADKKFKKLIERQSSQDYRERLNAISERESKDYGFDTGTILRPHEMSNTTNFSLQRLLQKALKVLVKVIGTFAVLGVMIGALLWLTAQGDENRITQGKEVVIWSCVGVALAYLSNILVNWWMDAVTTVIGG